MLGVAKPTEVTVDGRVVNAVDYDADARLVTVKTAPLATRKPARVSLSFRSETRG